jgi:hypothetical protein
MKMPQLYARLSRDRERVLCAVLDCGGHIGEVTLAADWTDAALIRVLRLPPGWAKGSDGMYRLTNYAKRQMKHGRAPKLRRRPKWAEQRPHAKEYLGHDLGLDLMPPLPAVAACPDCQRPQILDPFHLDVAADPILEQNTDPVPLQLATSPDMLAWLGLAPEYDLGPVA